MVIPWRMIAGDACAVRSSVVEGGVLFTSLLKMDSGRSEGRRVDAAA